MHFWERKAHFYGGSQAGRLESDPPFPVEPKTPERNGPAGIDNTLHSESVHADGFFHVRCLADKMEQTADLHSDNKFDHLRETMIN